MCKLSWILIPLLIAALALNGCDDTSSLIEDTTPNSPPDTEVSATPPEMDPYGFTIEFQWEATDSDGEIAGYQWRVSDNGEDGIIDIPDTLGLPWNFTTAVDSIFIVSADLDSFYADVDDPEVDPSDYRFWQTHTFFVRAVDEAGAVDPTPAHVSFTATTLAPTVEITVPVYIPSFSCRNASTGLTFTWEGSDPDNDGEMPAEFRTILLPHDDSSCMMESEYLDSCPIQSDNPLWSEWIPADAPDGSGLSVSFPPQEVGDIFFFAVQARDVAGAATPTFEWGVNMRHLIITATKYPLLIVEESFLPPNSFIATSQFQTFEVLEGTPLEFMWVGDASMYTGVIDAYRYGWDIINPDDEEDPGWAVPWGNVRSAPARSFTEGSPNFIVQCRDNSGTITRGTFQLQIIQIPERSQQRPLLLVDDYPMGDTSTEIDAEASWDDQWRIICSGHINGWDREMDIIDTQEDPEQLTLETLCEYRSVIWFVGPSTESFLQTQFANGRHVTRYNWLEAYQKYAGNLLITGPGAGFRSGDRSWEWTFPIIFDDPYTLGTRTLTDGSTVNVAAQLWPYTAWCLEALDLVDPTVIDPGGDYSRAVGCDAITYATVHEDFLASYPSAIGVDMDLDPTADRLSPHVTHAQIAIYQRQYEEFYNRDVRSNPATLVLRDCQTPMYRMVARRDTTDLDGNPLIADVEGDCPDGDLSESPIAGSIIGIASSAYSDTKPLLGSEDFLWGFHPLSFDQDEVKNAIHWICSDRWELDVR